MNPIIETARLRLVPLTRPCMATTPEDRATVAREMNAEVPESWPPEHLDREALDWCRDALDRDPANAGWNLRYIILREPEPTAIGMVGMGPPDGDGRSVTGYSILPEFRRQGYAKEALAGVVGWAFADPRVRVIVGDTYPHLVASIRTMEANGFRYAAGGAREGEATIRYELWR